MFQNLITICEKVLKFVIKIFQHFLHIVVVKAILQYMYII